MFDLAYQSGLEEALKVEPDLDKWLTGNGRVKGSTDAARRHETGVQQVLDYVRFTATDPFTVWEPAPDSPAVELEFTILLGGIEVKGFIDLVLEAPDGRLKVRDLKTGTKLPDTGLQLGVYAEAIDQLFGERPSHGDFYMCKNSAPTEPYDLSQYTTERLTRWFADMDRAESAGIYLPNPGDSCRVCTVQKWCDAVGSHRDDYKPGG